ncbi:MAG: isoprenylcysteine carboxylmethyltransferase family protein [Clostridiaceae bacterium]|jgi:protein-S-isoprenylcysteine O-methyltransferase Ste14|nr:isoprenylcysteine carboxylmethyltransferase family protein [Clostridiaceae bacterium]
MDKSTSAVLNKNAVLKSLSVMILTVALIFLCAGRWWYWQGILYCALMISMFLVSAFFVAHDPGLINEGLKPGQGVKAWDKAYLSASTNLLFITISLSALDSGRAGLSPGLPVYVYVIASVVYIAGNLIFAWAKAVRIQKEQGSMVYYGGPYRYVRHPGYLGSILHRAVTPLLLGSLWGLIPTGVELVLILVRTALEDKTLECELEGYKEYQAKVKYRLIPLIW